MASVISNSIYRNLLMLDLLEGGTTIQHDLLSNYSYYNYAFIGPARSGKTSLLFEYAFQVAENDNNVLYITRSRFEKLPHMMNKREQPNTATLKRIEILYLESVESFLSVMANIHRQAKKYELVIVDGIDEYCLPINKESVGVAAKVCAFTCDAVAHIRSCGLDTMFLCSMTSSLNSPTNIVQSVVEKWFPNTLHFYLHHRGNGYTIKSMTHISGFDNDEDIDVKGVHTEFKNGKILLQ